MALSLTMAVNLAVSDGAAENWNFSASKSETPASADNVMQVQSVGTGSWVALDVGNCSPADMIAVINNDGTNYVQLATANDGTKIFARIGAGRFALFPQDSGVTIYVKANTATCSVVVAACEA